MVVRARRFRGAQEEADTGPRLSQTILDLATREGRGVLTPDATSDARFDSALHTPHRRYNPHYLKQGWPVVSPTSGARSSMV